MDYQRECKTRVRLGIVGAGSHCYRNILPALTYLPVHLKAICDTDQSLAEKTATQYGCHSYRDSKEMYQQEELDAVLLVVSEKAHPILACEAFSRGLNVWMEKPAAVTSAEIEEMIRSRNGKIGVVGYKKAFMPATTKAREIIDSDAYTPMKSMLVTYPINQPAVIDGQCRWHVNACHPLSMILACNSSVASVRSICAEGGGLCVLRFSDGSICNFHFAQGPSPNESYTLYGDDWQLQIDNCARVTLKRGYPLEYGRTASFIPAGDSSGAIVWEPQNSLSTLENKANFVQGIYWSLKYFLECVQQDQPPELGSLEFALKIQKVYEAAHQSNGDEVLIPAD